MTSRQVVRAFFRGTPCPRPPLLPVAFYHAARIDGTPPERMAGDPTRLTRVLLDQHRLLGADCVAVVFDAAHLAERLGCRVEWSAAGPKADWSGAGPLPWPSDMLRGGPYAVLLEVVRRLKIELRREAPVLVSLPGPVSLWSRVCPGAPERLEEAGAWVRLLAEEACKAGAEIAVVEEACGGEPSRIASAGGPILNTLRYYNAYSILGAAAPVPGHGADAVLYGPASEGEGPPAGERAGLHIPGSCFESPEALRAHVGRIASRAEPLFLTARDDVLLSHPVEANVAVFRAFRGRG